MLLGGRAGLIEGFYGRPWSHQARLSIVRFLGELGLDWYVHAPKNDPKHRSRWQSPYEPEELQRLGELARAGRDAGVRVTVALAPQRLFGRGNLRERGDRDGDGIDDAQLAALRAKLDALGSVGVANFALFFDDTLATFIPMLATYRLGAFHARVANAIGLRLPLSDPSCSLFVTPAVYSGRLDRMGKGELAYYRGLSELDPRIEVAWTGPRIFSREIRGADARALSQATGLRLVVWNNAIANDYLPLASGGVVGLSGIQKLSFGPPENMSPDLPEAVSGVLLNAAREAELTKVALCCFADYVRAPREYRAADSHARALERVGGESGARTLALLYDLTQRHHLTTRERVDGARLESAMRRYQEGDPSARAALEAELKVLSELLEGSRESLSRHPIWDEIAPSLRKIDLLARAGLLGLEHAVALQRADPGAARALRAEERSYLSRARRIRWQVGLGRVARRVGG